MGFLSLRRMNGKDECASFTELMLSQQVRDIGSKSLFQILLLTLNHHPVFNYLFIYLQEKVKLEEVERLRNQVYFLVLPSLPI